MKMIHAHDPPPLEEILRQLANVRKWTPIDFGRYEGRTIPGLVLSHPSYFYWALSLEMFKDQLALEAKIAEGRLQHIKLPRNVSESSVFVVYIKNGIFLDFDIREKSKIRGKKRDDRIITPHLDFSIISRPTRNMDHARQVMLERLKYHFFEEEADKLREQDFEKFLSDGDNFAAGCPTKHIKGVRRWNHPAVLAETKEREEKKRERRADVMEIIEEAANRKERRAAWERRMLEKGLHFWK